MSGLDDAQFDDLLHSRVRLAALAALAGVDEGDFAWLKKHTGATDGNLSVHLRKLEEAGLLSVNKQFVERKPQSRYALTPLGRQTLETFLHKLETLLDSVRPQ